ncbi:hypothetical protein L6E12_01770 [Actinokineospora sp. PR83]|uniref:hypothetical protein n=1 Tax=Actinokineospora sp. PR83 TaxID=2884908 RepID=UPI001F18E85B|nr:hypothetical protein [Actinokineospora sp. PR83]MCG8914523.1 hypothetical protein [Actinokineospora sp. PR83]
MNRTRWRAVSTSAVAVAACLSATAPASASTMVIPCTPDPANNRWSCTNRPNIDVIDAHVTVGRLQGSRNYFFCREDGGDPHGGWIHTRADNGNYGFVQANNVFDDGDNLPDC